MLLELTYVDLGMDVRSVKCKRFYFLGNFTIDVEYADGTLECIEDMYSVLMVEVVYEK